MCWNTAAGLVQSVGEIRLDKSNNYPDFLQNSRYVIFKEEEDMLGLVSHAVCIDFALDSRGTTRDEAYEGLKNSLVSFIDVTLDSFTDKSKAYEALREQKENRDETRELVYRVYNEVLAHNETLFYAKLRPRNQRIYDSINTKIKKETSIHEFLHLLASARNVKKQINYYTHAYSEEDIESLYKAKKLSDDKIKKIVAFNYYLFLNSMIRQNQKAMV